MDRPKPIKKATRPIQFKLSQTLYCMLVISKVVLEIKNKLTPVLAENIYFVSICVLFILGKPGLFWAPYEGKISELRVKLLIYIEHFSL